jgi:hypothetical protein
MVSNIRPIYFCFIFQCLIYKTLAFASFPMQIVDPRPAENVAVLKTINNNKWTLIKKGQFIRQLILKELELMDDSLCMGSTSSSGTLNLGSDLLNQFNDLQNKIKEYFPKKNIHELNQLFGAQGAKDYLHFQSDLRRHFPENLIEILISNKRKDFNCERNSF